MDNSDDGYVPQISQIDYNLMDSGTNGNSSVPGYYNMSGGHMQGMYSAEMQQQHQFPHSQMMPNQTMPHGYPPNMAGQMPHGMMPGQMAPGMMPASAQQSTPQQAAATKPKRGGGRKKNTANQPAETTTPTQQALPASYPAHQMNPQMMAQMRQQSGNPYNYPMQQPSQSQQYMQQQFRPTQQGYPGSGYPMHPSAQVHFRNLQILTYIFRVIMRQISKDRRRNIINNIRRTTLAKMHNKLAILSQINNNTTWIQVCTIILTDQRRVTLKLKRLIRSNNKSPKLWVNKQHSKHPKLPHKQIPISNLKVPYF
jgi:hypothetical protein